MEDLKRRFIGDMRCPRKAKSNALPPCRPNPLHTTIFHAMTKGRIENLRMLRGAGLSCQLEVVASTIALVAPTRLAWPYGMGA